MTSETGGRKSGSIRSAEIDVTEAKMLLDRFHVWGHGLYLDEPRLEAFALAAR